MVIGVVVTVVMVGLLAGAAGLVVSAVRRRGSHDRMDPRSVRRFFQYLILFALVIVTCLGASELIARLLGSRPAAWEDGAFLLAQAWAFVLVGAPATGLLLWWTLTSHRRDPAERHSAWTVVYLTLMALVTATVTAVSLQGVIQALVADVELDADAAASLIVWGTAWAAHWWWARTSLAEGTDSFHILGGSVVGLVLMASGGVYLLGTSLEVLLLRPLVIGEPRSVLGEAAATFVAGVALWVWYWVAHGLRRHRDTIWLAAVLLVGVAGALVMALVSGTLLGWTLLVWLVGDPGGAAAAQHFASAPTQLSALLIGLVLWWYHRSVLGQLPGRPEVRRVYEYLVAGLGLAATAAGVGTVIVALIEAVTPGIDIGMSTLNTLLAAITLLVVGVPVWWLHWRLAQRALRESPRDETTSPSRRVFLAIVLGVSAIAAIVSLITVVFTLLQDAIDTQFGPATLRSLRYGLGVLVAAAAVALYHGLLVRAERSTAAGDEVGDLVPVPRSVVFIGGDAPDARRVLSEAGCPVEVWESSDAVQWEPGTLLAALQGHVGRDVVVVGFDDGTPRVMAVERDASSRGR